MIIPSSPAKKKPPSARRKKSAAKTKRRSIASVAYIHGRRSWRRS
jgi:hypothetical protein